MHWKSLRAGSRSPFTGFEWTTTAWVEAENPDLCFSGIHACRVEDLPQWLSDELWGIQLDGPIHAGVDKVVAPRARLLERVAEWTPEMAGRLATDCVRRCVVHAVAELRAAGPEYSSAADLMSSAGLDDAAEMAASIADSMPALHRRAAWLCGYVADAHEASATMPVGSVAYIAARAASQRSDSAGQNGYAQERAEQARWLVEHLPPLRS